MDVSIWVIRYISLEQFSDDIVTGLNNDVRDLNSDNDIFVYAYSASTRTVSISVADGLNFRLKVPTDNELSKLCEWNLEYRKCTI